MQTRLPVLSLVLLVATAASATASAAQRPERSFAEPTLAPDGSEIAFVSGGDIWVVPSSGGDARLLVAHAAEESRPLWSPDGRRLAFLSDRAGDQDVYVLDLSDGVVRRLTFQDASEELNAWSADGRWIWFSSGAEDVNGLPDVFRVAADGGTPMPVSADRYAEEFSAAPSPDGERLVLAARGRMAQGQWWRNGHSHIDESELWLVRAGAEPTYAPLSAGGKNLWPQWTADGQSVVFMSDRGGSENLWLVGVGPGGAAGEARALTRFQDGRVLFPSVSADGRRVAFERDFGIWTLDLPGGEPRPVTITLRGAVQDDRQERLTLTSDLSDLALAPDGKKVAFVVRGEVFAAGAEEGGDAARVTRSVAAESDPTWAPDSRRLAYVSRRDGAPSVWLHDFSTGEETRVTSGGADATPRFSPDGEALVYVRDGRELRVVDLGTGADRRLAEGRFWRPPYSGALEWSPDGRWIAWLGPDDEGFTNAHVVPAEGGPVRLASGLANSFGGSLAWDPEGESLYFGSGHRTEAGQIARVDLVPRTPLFRESRFEELFETPAEEERPEPEASPADGPAGDVAPPVEIEFRGIRRRLRFLPTGVDAGDFALSPDGKTLVLTASAEGQTNLYAFSVDEASDEPAVARQLTSTPGDKGAPVFAPDGESVFFLDRDRIARVDLAGGAAPRTVNVTARLDVDFDAAKVAAFEEAWTYLDDHFHDPAMHGRDWEGARRTFAPRIAGAASHGELRRLMNLMIGELNGSHLGYTAPSAGGGGETTGSLGLRFDRAAYERDGAFVVSQVVPLGPADVVEGIDVGDRLLAVDGRPLDARTNLDELLVNRVGRRVVLTVADAGGGAGHEVAVKPMSAGTERELVYREWVEGRRAYVAEKSGGRLGYVHMPDMGMPSLQGLIHDLDAENHGKDGVVVDIRNNNGGFVHAYALDVFARRGFLTMERRGQAETAARTQLGQRALESPTVLVVNQNTLSDGEDFTEGYRSLGLGTVVGEPTAGWIIYTGSLSLVNGGSIRMPSTRIRGADGEVMELNPRPVDVRVERPLGESYQGRDSQLDEAIRVLLGELDGRRVEQGGG